MPAPLPEPEQPHVTAPTRPLSQLPSEPNPAAGNLLPSARDSELLEALREGLGTPDLRIGALSPELMRQLGQLLRESTKGTVELLAARAALKREVRADVTTILASANNSLKFSPSVDVALQYLLGPRMMGFMPPVESMRDAYDDLKAHQLGVMAGMKAALAGVLERFDPKVVEGKLTAGSALSNLIPSSRKARLWELFQEVYQKLATEAEEDFNTLFGAAFLKAYQQYIDQLEGRDTRK
jgi:FHA domain-containing protein